MSPELRSSQGSSTEARTLWLYAFFFLSGFPALLYQLVWQRALFTIYGINIESVTMVVSAFMLGLGLGSLLGGWISNRPGVPLLMVFGLAEFGIGLCGFFSLNVFRYAAEFTAGTSALGTGLVTFALLMIPTALMGCTLPILTEHLVRMSGNVGRSVGALYFVNTLGSATACFAAMLYIMDRFGETGSVRLAAMFNAAVGLTVLILHFTTKPATHAAKTFQVSVAEKGERTFQTLPFLVTLPIAALSGFVALGYEILWYRAFSMAIGGRALAFAALLGFYLAGIAFGSLVSRVLCHRLTKGAMGRHLRNLAMFVIGANLLSYIILPSIGFLNYYNVLLVLPLVSLAAALLGATFPLICHAGVTPDERAGRGLSWLYVSNIIGSTVGSFLVGYVLMDLWPIKKIAVALAISGLALGAAMLISSEKSLRERMIASGISCVLALAVVAASGALFFRFYERVESHRGETPTESYPDIVETKSGVVTVHSDLEVFGSGVYDGYINTDLVHDLNGLRRPASISYWHPAPRDVLVIGMSTGAWTQIIANNPQVEKVTVVEINPGYLQVIRKYPQVRSLLDNPKVQINIDDGRRWLVRNKLAKFDVVVSNTTYHWRANISNLLSREFLQLVRSHLKPGGALIYNLTSSPEAQLTGLSVFPYAMRVGSCLVVSDSPFQLDIERWKATMAASRIDGAPMLDTNQPEGRLAMDRLANMYTSFPNQDVLRATSKATKMITDDNMGTEWASPFKSKWGVAQPGAY